MQDVIDLRALDGKEFVCLLLGQTSMYRYCHYVLAKILSFMNFYGSVPDWKGAPFLMQTATYQNLLMLAISYVATRFSVSC
jgi:hypothetical protein